MLAERRKKVIYSNPRGLLWANDKSKYGQRLLETMGWREGRGLGKSESGITENVKANFKFDNKGLGFKTKETEWIEENNVYEQILADLAKHHDTGKSKSQQKSDLESKSSGRLQSYRRFIKAKNLSSKSDHDLYCIFPTMKRSREDNSEIKSSQASCEDSRSQTKPLPTFESKMSIEEYFKQKMKSKVKSRDIPKSEPIQTESVARKSSKKSRKKTKF